ncbi:MAG: GNAT family N-acetyltransferase, partial [Treponema sp.]|nr:GNAT family N-acetyltransferase [Treponema sp.]
MNIDEITYEYYSHWTGVIITPQTRGVFFSHDPKKDTVPKGYSRTTDVYVFVNDNIRVVSYGTRAKERIEKIADKLQGNKCIDSLRFLLQETFLTDVGENIKYIYRTRAENPAPAVVLNAAHYDLFFEFFKENNLDVKDYSWLKEYFLGMAAKRYCHGIIIGNKLVSATDAPDMPYMQDLVQEIGINTLKEYRGKGYARAACVSLINDLLSRG